MDDVLNSNWLIARAWCVGLWPSGEKGGNLDELVLLWSLTELKL